MKKLAIAIVMLMLANFAYSGTCPIPEPVGCPNTTINMSGNTINGITTWNEQFIIADDNFIQFGNTGTDWVQASYNTGSTTLDILTGVATDIAFSTQTTGDILYIDEALVTVGSDIVITGAVTVGSYERHVQIVALNTGTVGSNPTAKDVDTVGCLSFPQTGNKDTHTQWEIPDDWDGTTAITFEVDWFPEGIGGVSGTDTVTWELTYRSVAEGESVQVGTIATISVADDGDYAQYITKHAQFVMPVAGVGGNQPLVKGDHVFFKIERDTAAGTDYGAAVCVPAFEIIYNSVSLPRG